MIEVEKYVRQYFIDNDIPLYNNRNKSNIILSIYGSKQANMGTSAYTRFSDKWFPDKPKKAKLYKYIIFMKDKMYCTQCESIKNIKEFNKGNTIYKLQPLCRKCNNKNSKNWSKENPSKRKIIKANYRAAKLNRTPSWANQEKINFWYECCPKGYHVDHIIPLNGKYISGLHIETNLQWLTPLQNMKKGNRWNG